MLKPTKLNTFKNCNFVKSLSVGQHVINRKIYLAAKEISKTPARRAAQKHILNQDHLIRNENHSHHN